MKRWMCMVSAPMLLGLALAAPAAACACGGRPPGGYWWDWVGFVLPIAVVAVAGWLTYRAFLRKAAK